MSGHENARGCDRAPQHRDVQTRARVAAHGGVGESHCTGVCVHYDDAGQEEEGGRTRTISSLPSWLPHQDLVSSYQLHQTVFFSLKYP